MFEPDSDANPIKARLSTTDPRLEGRSAFDHFSTTTRLDKSRMNSNFSIPGSGCASSFPNSEDSESRKKPLVSSTEANETLDRIFHTSSGKSSRESLPKESNEQIFELEHPVHAIRAHRGSIYDEGERLEEQRNDAGTQLDTRIIQIDLSDSTTEYGLLDIQKIEQAANFWWAVSFIARHSPCIF